MTDTVFLDLSEFNQVLDDDYPGRFVIIRSGDGGHRDAAWTHNHAWCERATRQHKIIGYGVYHVWRPAGDHGLGLLKAQVGDTHQPRLMVEWDIESWQGEIVGDHSAAITATVKATRAWLHGLRPRWQRTWPLAAWFRAQDRRRVRIYGNAGDLDAIAPRRPRQWVRLANYDANPARPRHWAHQFTDKGSWGKWHPVDVNSADGLSPARLARRLGFVTLTVRLA